MNQESLLVTETENQIIRPTTSKITLANRVDHFLARWGVRRSRHQVAPGLYSLGNPTPESPVLVTANYTLSFDSLRSVLKNQDCYILVLNTCGINVWCAAGKGTFGTDELVHRITATGLDRVVRHRKVILPQLGAAGVAAHQVKKRTGFNVEYGPVRAADLPAYLQNRKATLEMRRVRFPLSARLVLIPVELVHALVPMSILGILLYFLSGVSAALAVILAILAGVIAFPILLPWIPTPNFSTKGFILGGLVALFFCIRLLLHQSDSSWLIKAAWSLVYFLTLMPVTSFVALNFTGSTPFTSRTGVRREIFTYIPVMVRMLLAGLVLILILVIFSP